MFISKHLLYIFTISVLLGDLKIDSPKAGPPLGVTKMLESLQQVEVDRKKLREKQPKNIFSPSKH